MEKYANVFNWIALVWTILGLIAIVSEGVPDIWTAVYILVLVVAQVTALKSLK